MATYIQPAYGEGVGTGFLAGLTTRDLRPKQEALLNHPLWTGVETQTTTREQLALFALQDVFLVREIYRLDALAIAKAPTSEAADALIAKLTPKAGAEEVLIRFGEAVGLTREDFAAARPIAGCLALVAQFYYHLERSSFAETIACIGASETIFLEICGRIDTPLKRYGFSDEAMAFFSFHAHLEAAERNTTEMLRPLVKTAAEREAVTHAAELCYDFERLFYDAVLRGHDAGPEAFGVLPPLIAGVLILIVWQLGVVLSDVPESFLPSPYAVFSTLLEQRGLLWQNSLTTLTETVLGVGLAVVAALVWALLLDRFDVLKRALLPYFIASQTIPIIVLAPLMLLWFGFGLLPKTLLVALFAFFPIVLSTLGGLEQTPRERHDLMRSLAASPWQTFRFLRWPFALPSFLSGLRITLSYSVTGAIFSEYVGGFSGLGILLQTSANSRATALVFATIIVIALLSTALVASVALLERLLMPWRFQ